MVDGGGGDGDGSPASSSSSASSLSAADGAGSLSAGVAGAELAVGTGSAAGTGSACDVAGAGSDLWIEITDCPAGGDDDGGRDTGALELGSGSVPARLPGPPVEEVLTLESRIVNEVVVSALVPVRGAVPASGGAGSPGARRVEVTPLAEPSGTISVSTCFSRRNFSPQPVRAPVRAMAEAMITGSRTMIPGFCFVRILRG